MSKVIMVLLVLCLIRPNFLHSTESTCKEVDPTNLGSWHAEYVGFDGEFDLYLFVNPNRTSTVKTVLGAVLRVGEDKGVLVAYGYKSGNEPCLFRNTGSSFSRVILREEETRKPFQ